MSRPDVALGDAYRAVLMRLACRQSARDGNAEALNREIKAMKISGRPMETFHMSMMLDDWFWARGIVPVDEELMALACVLREAGHKAHAILRDIDDVTSGKLNNGTDGNANG